MHAAFFSRLRHCFGFVFCLAWLGSFLTRLGPLRKSGTARRPTAMFMFGDSRDFPFFSLVLSFPSSSLFLLLRFCVHSGCVGVRADWTRPCTSEDCPTAGCRVVLCCIREEYKENGRERNQWLNVGSRLETARKHGGGVAEKREKITVRTSREQGDILSSRSEQPAVS